MSFLLCFACEEGWLGFFFFFGLFLGYKRVVRAKKLGFDG